MNERVLMDKERIFSGMKDEAFRETHQYKNPAPVLLLQHTKETTFAAKAHWHDDWRSVFCLKGLCAAM